MKTCLILFVSFAALAQPALPPAIGAAVERMERYRITPNITYHVASGYENKLDVYQFRTDKPNATLVYIHGGGWASGYSKEQYQHWFLPFLHMGWNVVNVEYRSSAIALAPAAVEDCLCALRWVYKNAKQYNIDTARLVTMGHSAGGHLALTTGMIPASAELDRQCPGKEDLKVAAIVNWFGITDVADVADGPNSQTYAMKWFAAMPDRREVAKRVSPLTYVRGGQPPVISIHGNADATVPYSHAVRLHEALNKAKVSNELITVEGGKHGSFGVKPMQDAYASIFAFLGQLNLRATE
ncbi:MAG TPA: alpha/beta hydrolase [Bryobacteraceae bacterium]|nr:alpha/beta hydrolase [Bryobacteraceae bacterium]